MTLNLTIESVNDEPPTLTSNLTHLYTEGGGTIALLDSTATLHDSDNCPDHHLIKEILLEPINLMENEDILLDSTGQQIDIYTSQNGDFELGSASGSGVQMNRESETYRPVITLTCNETATPACYNDILQGLQYNNTADEPSSHDRWINLEVHKLYVLIPSDAISVTFQVVDVGGNRLSVQLTVIIELVNDNDPQLFLDGRNLFRDYQVTFYEGQDYLGGAVPVRLSDNLTIFDEDVGPQILTSAIVDITDCK